jgi:hypothetical protein
MLHLPKLCNKWLPEKADGSTMHRDAEKCQNRRLNKKAAYAAFLLKKYFSAVPAIYKQ